jgi:hypothetical protein
MGCEAKSADFRRVAFQFSRRRTSFDCVQPGDPEDCRRCCDFLDWAARRESMQGRAHANDGGASLLYLQALRGRKLFDRSADPVFYLVVFARSLASHCGSR